MESRRLQLNILIIILLVLNLFLGTKNGHTSLLDIILTGLSIIFVASTIFIQEKRR